MCFPFTINDHVYFTVYTVYLQLFSLVSLGFALVDASSPGRHYPRYNVWGQKIKRVAFIGDSLCPDTENVKKIMDYMNKRHPQSIWHSIQDCYGGSILNKNFPDCDKCRAITARKNDIIHRMENDVLRHKPEVIFLLWDSDAADIDEGDDENDFNHGLPSKARVRQYNIDLDFVLNAFLKSGAHVIVGGPGLFGELPRGQNVRDPMMDAYETLTSHACQRYNITYFNIREAFFTGLADAAGKWTPHKAEHSTLMCGFYTIDGEHFTKRGHDLVLNGYLAYLDKLYPSNT